MKTAYMLTALCFLNLIAIPISAQTETDGKLCDTDAMKKWSIPFVKVAPAVAPKQNKLEVVCTGRRWPGVLYLTRPGEKNYVAVIQYEPGSPTLLNPNGFDYGSIPPLKVITREQIESLWGLSESSRGLQNVQTYRLATSASDPTGDLDVFLDICFEKNRPQKYRVRSDIFDHFDRFAPNESQRLSAWQNVQ
jgi:hypothetical protein